MSAAGEAAGYRRIQGTPEHPEIAGPSPLLPPSAGLSSVEADALLRQHGPNCLPAAALPGWALFLRCCFAGPLTVTAWCLVAALAAAGQRWLSCAVLAVALMAVGSVAFRSLRRVQGAARAVLLEQRRRPSAVALRDGRWEQLPPSLLVPGDLLRLHPGAVVPADCTMTAAGNDGGGAVLEVSEAALTGESLPVAMGPEGALLLAGSVVVQGEATATVQFTGGRSHAGRLVRGLQQHRSSPARRRTGLRIVMTQILFVVTTGAAALVVLSTGFLLGLRAVPVRAAAAVEAVLLLALLSLPLGLEAAVAAATAVGGWRLARRDCALPLRLSSLDALASMDLLFVDKTGTLTANALQLQQECHLFPPTPPTATTTTRNEALLLAALALRWREPAADLLDALLLAAADLSDCDAFAQLEYVPFSAAAGRSEATVRAADGTVFKITKGAVNAVLGLLADRERLRPAVERVMGDLGRRGLRCVMVARTEGIEGENGEGPTGSPTPQSPLSSFSNPPPVVGARAPAATATLRWHAVGILTFLDPLRPAAAPALRRLVALGVTVKVITGDHPLIAKEAVRRLGLGNAAVASTAAAFPWHRDSAVAAGRDATLGDSYGAVLRSFSAFAGAEPHHKCLAVEVARQCGHTVGFLGDGINDASALQHADVGIAFVTEDCSCPVLLGPCESVNGGDGGHAHSANNEEEVSPDETTALLEATAEAREREETVAAAAPFSPGAAPSSAAWGHAVASVVALRPDLHAVADTVVRARGAVAVVEGLVAFRVVSALQAALFAAASPFVAALAGTTAEPPLRLPPLFLAAYIAGTVALTVAMAHDRPPPVRSLGRPHQWNVAALLTLSAVVATLGSGSSLLLLWGLCRAEWGGSLSLSGGLPPALPRAAAAPALYLHLSLSAALSVLSCRAPAATLWWRRGRPSAAVTAVVLLLLALPTAVAALLPWRGWPVGLWGADGDLAATPALGLAWSSEVSVRLLPLWVWAWALLWWGVQESARVAAGALLVRFNLLHLRETQTGGRPPRQVGRDGRDGSSAWQRQHRGVRGMSLGALDIIDRRLIE